MEKEIRTAKAIYAVVAAIFTISMVAGSFLLPGLAPTL